jgi:D-alanyl-D-alanine carboxypeptidase
MYQSNVKYSDRKPRLNKQKVTIVGIIIALIVMGTIFYGNRVRIQLIMKGYNFTEQRMLLDVADITPYLEHKKIDTLSLWNDLDNNQLYLEYHRYYLLHKTKSAKEVVEFIDDYDDNYRDELEDLGYQEKTVWEMFEYITLDQIRHIVDRSISYNDVKEFLALPFFQIEDLSLYVQNKDTHTDPVTNVLMTSYLNIDTSNNSPLVYEVQDPLDLLVLVKKGFQLPEGFQPNDLVTPDIPIAPDSTSPMIRKEAAGALEKMVADAKKEGYELVLNSAFRSYEQQQEVYDLYFELYDEVTARGLVALPGTSEHQTGLAIDFTSQSVLDGERLVFGDTAESRWLRDNAFRYGFIFRYPPDRMDATGTSAEPWHYRYVGIEAAQEIQNKNWILEDYILAYGFNYSLIRQ